MGTGDASVAVAEVQPAGQTADAGDGVDAGPRGATRAALLVRPLPRLLAFTDASIRTGHHAGAAAAAIATLGPAIGLVARDHDATAAELTDFAALLMAEARAHEAAIIVAGRPDLAAGLGAHGVQLRAQDLSPADARLRAAEWLDRAIGAQRGRGIRSGGSGSGLPRGRKHLGNAESPEPPSRREWA